MDHSAPDSGQKRTSRCVRRRTADLRGAPHDPCSRPAGRNAALADSAAHSTCLHVNLIRISRTSERVTGHVGQVDNRIEHRSWRLMVAERQNERHTAFSALSLRSSTTPAPASTVRSRRPTETSHLQGRPICSRPEPTSAIGCDHDRGRAGAPATSTVPEPGDQRSANETGRIEELVTCASLYAGFGNP